MPFQSESQRRFMWMKHPEIAKRWAKEYPGQHDLPMYKNEDSPIRTRLRQHGALRRRAVSR